MTDSYKIVNPKQSTLMSTALQKVYNATFDEMDMRILVLGVRSFADSTSILAARNQPSPTTIQPGLSQLADIGHTLAHPEIKEWGALHSYVKKIDKQMMIRSAKVGTRKVLGIDVARKRIDLQMHPIIKPLSSNNLFLAFCIALQYCFPYEVNTNLIFKQRDDILLCLFSILHFTQMPHLDGASDESEKRTSRAAYLGLHSWKNRYHLYAGVMNSKLENLFSPDKPRERTRPFINVFPVYNGTKEVGKGPEMDIFNPQIVFAVRDLSGALTLKVMNQSPSNPR